jgi:hydrogenase expression/formation protein HypC
MQMCLGIPGKIIDIYESGGLMMGKVDFGGATREACLAYVPEAQVGDYTIIHVGFALNVISEEEAQETLALLREIAELETELGPELAEAGPNLESEPL